MQLKWKKATSNIYPGEVDYTSSATIIYIFRNVKKIVQNDVLFYEYEVAKLTPAEFAIYSAAKTTETQLTIMEALADLYEKVGEQS